MIAELASHWAPTVPPTIEPLTLTEAKAFLRSTHAREDALVAAWIVGARQACEQYTRRALLTQTWVLQLSMFADVVPLPWAAPLQSVASVEYADGTGSWQTLDPSAYDVNVIAEPGQIERGPAVTWPIGQCDRALPVRVTYVAGWTMAVDVPEPLKQGMRIWIAAQDADRLGAMAGQQAAAAFWDPYRVYAVPPRV